MKRLKKYFSEMDKNDVTYNAVYNGNYSFTKTGMVLSSTNMKKIISDSEYWYHDISFTLERSHKKTPDLARVRIRIPLSRFLFSDTAHQYDVVVADQMLRKFIPYIDEVNKELYHPKKKKTETGYLYIYRPDSRVLDRNAAYIERTGEDKIQISILLQFPLHNHKKASRILCETLPEIVDRFILSITDSMIQESICLYQKQEQIRHYLTEHNLCAFVANGSNILNSDDCVLFESPLELTHTIAGITGMIIPNGITTIIGGGFSGKSTLLEAIRSGIYNHTIDDGRKFIITVADTAYIMAEDGRTIHDSDISYFVKPNANLNTVNFSTNDASGSTSEAANVMEALQMGTKLLLIDEDKSAANFLIRDIRMDAIVKNNPIIPLSERLVSMKEQHISLILVVGANYELLQTSDTVLIVDNYRVKLFKHTSDNHKTSHEGPFFSNRTYPSISIYDESGTETIEANSLGYLIFGQSSVYSKPLKTIESFAQLSSIGGMLKKWYWAKESGQSNDIIQYFQNIIPHVNGAFLDNLSSGEHVLWFEKPRMFDILSILNRF